MICVPALSPLLDSQKAKRKPKKSRKRAEEQTEEDEVDESGVGDADHTPGVVSFLDEGEEEDLVVKSAGKPSCWNVLILNNGKLSH